MRKSKPGIYKPLGANGFELCHPLDKEDYERLNIEIGGTSLQASWKPISVQLIREDEGRALASSDSPWLGYGPLIFRPVVVEALGPLLREYGELLPLTCSEADLVIYNPSRVIDALDEAASSVMRFPDGRIMLIQKHVFRGDVVGESDIFTIPEKRVRPIFLSHRFVDRWKASGLKGLEFKQVWASPN
jgi:hypothetical protein